MATADVSGTLGALYLGGMASAVLFGVTSIQTYIYFSQYPKDRALLKASIFTLWIIDTLHVATTIHEIYFYGVTNYGNFQAIGNIPWSADAQVVLTTLSDSLVRGVFAHRVWILSRRNKPLLALISIASALDLSFGLALAAKCVQIGTYEGLTREVSWIVYTSLGVFAGSDIIITIALYVLLMRSRSAFTRTNTVVHTLMLYTINTSALASLCAVVTLVTFITMHNLVFHALLLVLPKLYLNALLATLNARNSLRRKFNDPVAIPLSQISGSRSAGNKSGEPDDLPTEEGRIGIHIDKTTEVKYDPELGSEERQEGDHF